MALCRLGVVGFADRALLCAKSLWRRDADGAGGFGSGPALAGKWVRDREAEARLGVLEDDMGERIGADVAGGAEAYAGGGDERRADGRGEAVDAVAEADGGAAVDRGLDDELAREGIRAE
jgi:hypothetical protein